MAEGEAEAEVVKYVPEPLPDVLVAEEAAAAAIEDIIKACGEALYSKYLGERAYKFAAQTITEVVVGHLRMCFVQHDPGDMKGGDEQWQIEEEVPCSELDSWCRRVVPIQTRIAKTPSEPQKTARRGSPKKKAKKPQEDEKKRGRGKAESDVLPAKLPKPEREIDEYEDMLREYKIREEKRKKEAEEERKKREAEEQEKQRELLKAQEELAKWKGVWYDSRGLPNKMDPPNMAKLPPTILATGFHLQMEKESPPPPDKKPKRGVARGRAKPKKPRKARVKELPEFTDSFSKLTTLQPPAYEVMELVPGMELEEQAKTKRGPPLEHPEGKMTRSGYKLLCEEEKQGGSHADLRKTTTTGSEDLTQDGSAMSQSDAFNREIAQMDPNLWGRNPPLLEPDLRALSAQAPNTVHDWRQKREAVGNLGMHPRDRIAELGSTSGWRLPQPPLGATMGHGLLKGAQTGQHELHFFPTDKPAVSPRQQRTPEHSLRRPDLLPSLPKAPSLPALAQTQGSTYPWMDPGVMDVRFARSHSGGAITSSKSEMLRSMLR